MTRLEIERQRLRRHIAAEPTKAQAFIQRGMAHFKLGSIAAAIADFDRAEALNPALRPYLWQRGLAYYYAGRFEAGAQQFEVDLTVNNHDVEETVWRYLCQAQLLGTPTARQALQPVRNDPRPVMGWVYALFAGACDADTVLRAGQHAGHREHFYSHLYVGLYFEAERDTTRARQHISQAAAMQVLADYMGWLAIVHQCLRGWAGTGSRTHS